MLMRLLACPGNRERSRRAREGYRMLRPSQRFWGQCRCLHSNAGNYHCALFRFGTAYFLFDSAPIRLWAILPSISSIAVCY